MVNDYPATVNEILDPDLQFTPALLRAVRAFANSRPWTGSLNERKEKFRLLNRALAETCGVAVPDLRFQALDGASSGRSHYTPADHRITLMGKLSVVTFLHEWRHAWQYVKWGRCSERDACWWSINLFRTVWPAQYRRLDHSNHMLVSQNWHQGDED